LYVWIEFLRQNRSGVTDRTGDRTDSKRQEDSKRQDRQQGTGQGLKVRLSKMRQDNTIMAGEGGLLSKIGRDRKRKQEWWDRTRGSEQKGEDRQESREKTEQLRNRDSNPAQHDKI
jgi:hypothetical protein